MIANGISLPRQWLRSLKTGTFFGADRQTGGGSDASKSVREQSLVLEGD